MLYPKTKKWDGKKWVDVNVKVWSEKYSNRGEGPKWTLPIYKRFQSDKKWYSMHANISTYKAVDEFDSLWTASYQGNNKLRDGAWRRLYQGKYGEYDPTNNITHNPVYWGRQRSLIGFSEVIMQATLKNSHITKVELFLNMEHSWFHSGAIASICTHNFNVRPEEFNSIHYNIASYKFTEKDKGVWIEIPVEYGEMLARGEITGFGLYRESDDQLYYGYWTGFSGFKPPKLRITHEKYLEIWPHIDYSGARNIKTKKIVTESPKYFEVPEGWGFNAVTRELMGKGVIPNEFNAARDKLMELNNFHTTAPFLLIGQKIMYDPAKTVEIQ